jgi:hypothetical protein
MNNLPEPVMENFVEDMIPYLVIVVAFAAANFSYLMV